MPDFTHLIRKCVKPNCSFRFHNNLSHEQYIYCPKCGSQTEIIETPYDSMICESGDKGKNIRFELLLDNIRSAYNVGSILRTSDGIGVDYIHFCGITPTPDHPKVKKTALSAEQLIPWDQYWNSIDAIHSANKNGLIIIALEGGQNSHSIFDILADISDKPILLILGNEVSGVDPGLLNLCNKKVWLPMTGSKQSFNVSVAFGIAAYLIRYSNQLKGGF